MGVTITVGGKRVHESSYTVNESSTPLAGGDSSGGVGTIEAQLVNLPMNPVAMNLDEPITLIDTARGVTAGTVREVANSHTPGARYSVTANTRLGEFNIEAQVSPFSGTLEAAFRYYCSLANIDTGILVDSALSSKTVNFPGWYGNLWNHMKMMATAVRADLNLISGNVVLRPVRLFEAIRNREVEVTATASALDLARKQEVIWYRNRYVPRGLIYPSGGYRSDIVPLSVAAGETQEYTLDSSRDVQSSIFSLEQPVPKLVVAPNDYSSSAYTVIGDDNIRIPPQQWLDYGGKVTVRISEDTRAIIVTITGASNLFQSNGEPMRTFRLGLSADSSNSAYQTLRIVGQHIAIEQNSVILPTGVPDYRTGQEFAPTIDNPFLNDIESAYSAGVRGARRYAGRTLGISGSVSAINRRGQTGTANYPPYSYAQGRYSPMTYGAVLALNSPKTYGRIQQDFYDTVQDSFDNQIYGNAPGARYWDPQSARWYRVREASVDWSSIEITGDDDLTNGDIQKAYAPMTYGTVASSKYAGLTYHKANLKGIA
ncbi:minor tail protein [Microbacterium phage Fork]|nr:minor tail protein [Microbacterium phage Fork]